MSGSVRSSDFVFEDFLIEQCSDLIISGSSFAHEIIKLCYHSKSNVIANNVCHSNLSTDVNQINNFNSNNHECLHQARCKWNPPSAFLKFLRMVISKFHNLHALFDLVLHLEMEHHGTHKSHIVLLNI